MSERAVFQDDPFSFYQRGPVMAIPDRNAPGGVRAMRPTNEYSRSPVADFDFNGRHIPGYREDAYSYATDQSGQNTPFRVIRRHYDTSGIDPAQMDALANALREYESRVGGAVDTVPGHFDGNVQFRDDGPADLPMTDSRWEEFNRRNMQMPAEIVSGRQSTNSSPMAQHAVRRRRGNHQAGRRPITNANTFVDSSDFDSMPTSYDDLHL